MSRWTHIICENCWWRIRSDRQPVRYTVRLKPFPCCFCGEPTQSGIFVRGDPKTVKCGGEGVYHDEWSD